MDSQSKLDLVWQYIYQGQYPVAIDRLKELLGKDPNEPMYHGVLAMCLLLQLRLHAAEYEIKLALALDAQEAFLFVVYGRIYFLQNKFKAALGACDEAIKLNPLYPDAFELKADILLAAGRNKEAFENIQQLAALAPNSATTAYAFAHFYFKTGERNKAFTFAAQTLNLDAQHLDANVLIGRIFLMQGNVDEALYHARLAVTLNPSASGPMGLLADIKSRQNVFLAPWWKLNAKISGLSQLRQVGVIVFGYVFFGLLSNVVHDVGYPKSAVVIDFAWLGFVIYTWVAIPIYYRMVQKEIEQFRFKTNY
ncbi:MAG: CDC27 family protein [Marinagarivorans sp.]